MIGIPTLGWPELLLILVALLLLFGARKLPEMARSLGRSSKEFKAGLREGAADSDAPETPEKAQTPEQSKPPE
ncbi:MAG: twin-arginine translocase TatA/TatE family subunit [Actinomycetota bacterium]